MSDVVDAEYEEQDAYRPCLGIVEVPVDSVDGEPSVGAVLQVRGLGDEFVILEIGGRSVRVYRGQLAAALQSLAVLALHEEPEPAPPPFGFGPPPVPVPGRGRQRSP